MQNKQKFAVSQLPQIQFEIEQHLLSGKIKLKADDKYIECERRDKNLFNYYDAMGNLFAIYIKPQLFGMGFHVFVNKVPLETSAFQGAALKWYEIVLAFLPLVLIMGGAIGGGIGALAAVINMNLFKGNASHRYLKVVGVTVLAIVIYSIIAFFILKTLNI